jgi:hypothetical protein
MNTSSQDKIMKSSRRADSSNNKNKSLNTGNNVNCVDSFKANNSVNKNISSFSSSNSNNNRPTGSIEINGCQTGAVAIKTQRQRSKDSGFGDAESPKDNYQQWKKLATIAKELHVKEAGGVSGMLVEVKKQIPTAPVRRARRHALSAFNQLNTAERERLGKINPTHKSSFETKDSNELVKEYVYAALVSKCRPRSASTHEGRQRKKAFISTRKTKQGMDCLKS